MTLHQLRDQRAAAWTQAQEFNLRHEAGDQLTRADEAAWSRALDEVERLGTRIEHAERAGGFARLDDVGVGAPSDGIGAVGAGGPAVRDTSPHAGAFRSYLRGGDDVEMRALGVGTGSAGGFTVPQGFRATVTETMKAYGGLRRLAEVITTDEGNDLPWPTNNDTANEGTGEQAENTPVTEQDVTFGGAELNAYMYPSGIVRVSMQLLQDAGFPLDSWLARKLGQRIGRRQAGRWITGTGTDQPQGITVGGVLGKTAGSPTAITYDDLVDLQASVDAAYTDGGEVEPGAMSAPQPGVAWVMHQLTLAALRKLVDANEHPLIAPDVAGRAPTTLLGYPIVIDNAMPVIAASARPLGFGNFRAGYIIRDVRQIEVLRLVERYADALQHGFLAWQRADGLVQDPSAFKLLAMAA